MFSLSFFSLTVYDVLKKAGYGRNTLKYKETNKNNARYYGRDYFIYVDEVSFNTKTD